MAGAPASRFDQLRDGGGISRLDSPAREFGPGFAHRPNQFSAAAFGDSLEQRGSQLLLFLQRKMVSGIERVRIRRHARNIAEDFPVFNSAFFCLRSQLNRKGQLHHPGQPDGVSPLIAMSEVQAVGIRSNAKPR